MLNRVLSISLFALSTTVFSKTLTLKPGADGKDAVIFSRVDLKGKNYGNSARIHSETWTWDADGLGQGTYRSLLQFNLDSLPRIAEVISAKLYLYCDTLNYTKGQSSLSTSNASWLLRVKEAWAETSVTWNNQPATDTAGRLPLAQSKSVKENYVVDVTDMVSAMVADSSKNHGFLLRSMTESPYNSMSFGSGDHVDSSLHPKLVIEYEDAPFEKISLRPGAEGKDAVIFSRMDLKDKNYANSPRIHSETWTWDADGLGQGTYRSLVAFDLKNVPRSATVKSAKLHLYCDTVNYTKGQSSLSTSNASWLLRVKDAWAESTVTWNNQPATDTAGRLPLAQSKSVKENYIVDVTTMVADMLATPSGNHGFLLKSVTENPYNSMSFGSGDHTDTSVHPRLEIRYTLEVTGLGKSALRRKDELKLRLMPGASARVLVLSRPATGFVTNLQGKVVSRFENAGSVSLADFNRGAYVLAAGGSALKFVVP